MHAMLIDLLKQYLSKYTQTPTETHSLRFFLSFLPYFGRKAQLLFVQGYF